MDSWFKDSRGHVIKEDLFLNTSRILESSTPRTLVAKKIILKYSPQGEVSLPIPERDNNSESYHTSPNSSRK